MTNTGDVASLAEALREQGRRMAELEELARLGSWHWDVDADVVSWSAEMYRLFDRQPDQVEPSYEGYLDCLHSDDRDAARANVERALTKLTPYNADYRVVCGDGSIRWLHCRGRAVTDDAGTVVRLIGTTQDVTDRKQLEERLVHEALHDSLTGLPARTLLEDRLEHALQRSSRTELLTAVFFVDIDQFKTVNDRAGHDTGDRALRELADRLRAAVRTADTVARFAGDEFVIIAEELVWPDEAAAVARRIHSAATFAVVAGNGELTVTASVGAAVARPNSAVDEVLREADQAMYRAKQTGDGIVCWFGDSPDDRPRP